MHPRHRFERRLFMSYQLEAIVVELCLAPKFSFQLQCCVSGQALNNYQAKNKLDQLPSLLEFLSYVFAIGNLLAGPFFEISDYLAFVERRGEWASTPGAPAPVPWATGTLRFVKGLLLAAAHVVMNAYFPVATLESAWYMTLNVPQRCVEVQDAPRAMCAFGFRV
jgi:MBOAT, membrane-bound O-acyltransferase family